MTVENSDAVKTILNSLMEALTDNALDIATLRHLVIHNPINGKEISILLSSDDLITSTIRKALDDMPVEKETSTIVYDRDKP